MSAIQVQQQQMAYPQVQPQLLSEPASRRPYSAAQSHAPTISPEEQFQHDLNFLKTFFESNLDEATIAATLTESGKDRERAFEKLFQRCFNKNGGTQQA